MSRSVLPLVALLLAGLACVAQQGPLPEPVSMETARSTLDSTSHVGGTIVGQVLEQDGTPSSGRKVQAIGPNDTYKAQSDADGRFRFEHVTAGIVNLSVEPRESDLERLRVAYGTLPEDASSLVGEIRRVEARDGETANVVIGGGRVHVEGILRPSAPIARALVLFTAHHGMNQAASVTKAMHTDAVGHYAFDVDQGGEFVVQISSGGMTLVRSVQIPDVARAHVDIELPSGRIAGRVLDPNGEPLAGADVHVWHDGDRAKDDVWFGGFTRSSTGGAFMADGLCAGTWHVQARSPRGSSAQLGPATRNGLALADGEHIDDVVLQMTKGASLQVQVTDVDGRTAPGAFILIQGESFVLAPTLDGPKHTDADGRARLEGLPSGRLRFAASIATRTSRWSAPIDSHPGSFADIALTLEEGATLHVVLDDASGAQLANQREHTIELVDEVGSLSIASLYQEMRIQAPSQPYTFSNVPPGRWTVSTDHGKAKTVVQLTAGASETVHLRP